MRKIYILFAFLLATVVSNAQQLDRSIRPSAAPAKELEIKDAQSFTLPNGLKVFVVEDHRSPVILYSVMLDIKPALDGKKAGASDLFTAVIGTATKNRSKEQLNNETDLIGARISSSTSGGSVSGLKKYESKMLELFSDVLLNPVFNQSEMNLQLEQQLSELKTIGDNAGTINKRLSRALTYGKDYPGGEIVTEESLKNVTIKDLEKYHQTYFAPNVARLVIVGDITLADAKANAAKYFGNWKQKKVPVTQYAIPTAPQKNKVAFVEKSGAIQSAIDISYTINLKPGDADAIAADVMAYILGGGSSGHLFQNLREQHSYTYGVYNILNSGELVGRYNLTAGRGNAAQVKATATDSAIFFIREEMQNMINKPVSETELKNAKAFLAGSFGRSLESANTIASFAVMIDKYKLPKDYFKTYLKRLDALTTADIQAAAQKFLKPDNAWIIVVGDKSHVEGLKQFSGDNTVQYYDLNANPITASEATAANISPEAIINNYVKALGGAAAIEAINDYKIIGSGILRGNNLSLLQLSKRPNMSFMSLSVNNNVMQQISFDGKILNRSSMQGAQEFTEGKEFESAKMDAGICPVMDFVKNGYKMAVKGVEKVGNSEAYVLEVSNGNTIKSYCFDSKSGLLVKTVENQETPYGTIQQAMEYGDYRPVNGMLFPYSNVLKVASMEIALKINNIEVNSGLSKADFQ